MNEIMIDVREKDEFEAEHVKNSVNIPLSQFNHLAPGILTHFMDRKVLIMCRSGNRAKMAEKQASSLGFQPKGGFEVYQGGIIEWKKQGKDVVSMKKGHMPILRQTHFAAGALVIVGVLLGHFINPLFYWISGAVGIGLSFAGLSGVCLMSNLLAFMPWNKNIPELQKEVCVASTGTDCNLN